MKAHAYFEAKWALGRARAFRDNGDINAYVECMNLAYQWREIARGL